MNNKLVIAAAGSGKTSYLVDEALSRKDNVLITTYTKTNEEEIRRKFYIKPGYIPSNIEIQSWFEFLLRHGVRPYQGSMHDFLFERKIGFGLVNEKSTLYVKESDILKYYFNSDLRMYSDKVSKFAFRCNEKLHGKIIDRMTKIYSHIFIDEVQDLVGYDLALLREFCASNSEIIMVGDPRQATFSTHPTDKYPNYKNGNIESFIRKELPKEINFIIDTSTLLVSHRNNDKICSFSSKLFPMFPEPTACNCIPCRNYSSNHVGVFLIRKKDIANYLVKFKPVQLRWSIVTKCSQDYPVYNFGAAKGLSFDRVLIYPTQKMTAWIKDSNFHLEETTRAKFYVAITRARISVAIVMDFDDDEYIEGIEYYKGNIDNE
jgi:DNA helicase-2/ATP-dependent DNA helicase PcrA